MPRIAISEELELIRSDGQASKLYAAFFVPHTIYTAVLSSVPPSTDQVAQISFGSGSGTLSSVKPDMLLKIGSSAGLDDLGIARIRKAPIAGTFYIGEQSIIDWSAAPTVYLTVVDDFDIWAKHVRIDGTTIYMDYDVSFSDQHTIFSPVPVLGPVVSVVELTDGSGFIQIGPETGYQSWVHGSSISSYLWSSPSVDVSFDNTALVRPVAEVTSPGWHPVYCLVTAANGKTKTGVRYIFAWDKDNMPLIVAQLGDNREDHKIGGSSFSLSLFDNTTLGEIPDRALCVLFSVDYYGAGDNQTKISIGAVSGRENVIYTGRVVAESLAYDMEDDTLSIDVHGYQEYMKRIHGFPAGLRLKAIPAIWTDMPSMTVDKALWHLLEWHTTITTVMDFNKTGDVRLTAQAFSPLSSLWEQAKEFAERQIAANTRVDHLGRLFFEIDPLLMPIADRNYPIVMTLTNNDIIGRVDLPREVLHETGQVNLSGVAIDSGGNASAFFSLSPGHIHARTGRIEVLDKLLLEDQTQANELAGLKFAQLNNPYKPMRIRLRANNRLITCFPNQAVSYTVPADKNPRGFAISKNWIPRQRKISYEPETGVIEIELVLEAETIPMHAVAGDIPGSGDFTFPPLPGLPSLPSLPILLPGGSAPGSEDGPTSVLVHDPTFGLAMTNDFNSDEPTWFTINTGLTSTQYSQIQRVILTPSGALYAICERDYIAGVRAPFVARAAFAGAEWEIIEDENTILAKIGGTINNVRISGAGANPLLSDTILYTVGKYGYGCKLVLCEAGIPAATIDIGHNAAGGEISYGDGYWLLTGANIFDQQSFFKISADAGTIVSEDTMPGGGIQNIRHVRVSTTGTTYHYASADGQLTIGENNCASFIEDVAAVNTITEIDRHYAIDPTGQYHMAVALAGNKGRSSDAGYTWTALSALVPATWFFEYAGGAGSSSRWVAGSAYMMYSDDFGDSWFDKKGNLPDLNPIFQLDIVKVLEF